MKSTIHLVYPCSDSVACPGTIGRHLAEGLSEDYGYPVVRHEWDDWRRIEPQAGDILLGHPHPNPLTVFRRSLGQRGWRKRIVLAPFNTDPRQVGFHDSTVQACDAFLAISGEYWFSQVMSSPVRHWARKLIHVDLAVDQAEFPRLKERFNPAGRRRVLYIGHSGWQKNPEYLESIAAALPAIDFGWLGAGARRLEGYTAHGFHDLGGRSGRDIIREYDFLLTVGRYDANPATILEAMSWGLIPVCTPQSGYVSLPGIVNVPLDDVNGAARALSRLQHVHEATLFAMQAANSARIRDHFNWNRFTGQVVDAIEEETQRPNGRSRRRDAASLRAGFIRSAYYPWRPLNLARFTYRGIRRIPRSFRHPDGRRTA